MEQEHDIPAKFVKRKKPEVPAGFFEHFYAGLKDETDALDAFKSLGLAKRERPMRPSTPWAAKTDEVAAKPAKRGRVIRLRVISVVSAAAATLALLLYFNPDEQAQAVPAVAEVNATNPAENEAELETYVAYLDEEELIDYIIENDISMGEEDEEVYDIVESDIEEIYLDL